MSPEVIVDDEDYEQPTCNQPWNKGKRGLFQHTEESKSKITGRPKGFVQTDEWKENKSKSMRGNNNHFYGKNHTDEVRKNHAIKEKIIRKDLSIRFLPLVKL
jgi:hypothetical protein